MVDDEHEPPSDGLSEEFDVLASDEPKTDADAPAAPRTLRTASSGDVAHSQLSGAGL